ncbi:ABC transporter permease [Fusibacter sp. 3D3]|uniref:ABC transporter permease n=1 Tax=Fusibacter sp. 3D3 TaxID=1048380 RepID=UPI0008535FDB|nr:ABC transporter permease [Fusibacter sp. 3D3]GAU79784.1 dipeptide transport system permease protein DppB [Fusibacter sp. 3D3]
MFKYVTQRLLLTIPVLIGAVFLVFAIMSLTPGDPGTLILGMTADKQDIARLNMELGYDQPFLMRFFNYVKDIVLHFDFGISYRTQTPVFVEILSRFPHTVKLAVFSIILSSIFGITLGIISAVKQYSYVDSFFTILAMFFAAIPGFWFGLMLMLLFSLKLGWLPSNGVDTWKHFILPTITLSVGSAAGLLRLTRSTMLETIRQDYIRTARAKGASEQSIIINHALKNALLPVITSLGMNFGASLGGAIIIESVFGMPGLGTHIVTAIRQKDVPVVLASTLLLAFLFSMIMLIIDLLYAFIDPRIKSKYAK